MISYFRRHCITNLVLLILLCMWWIYKCIMQFFIIITLKCIIMHIIHHIQISNHYNDQYYSQYISIIHIHHYWTCIDADNSNEIGSFWVDKYVRVWICIIQWLFLFWLLLLSRSHCDDSIFQKSVLKGAPQSEFRLLIISNSSGWLSLINLSINDQYYSSELLNLMLRLIFVCLHRG